MESELRVEAERQTERTRARVRNELDWTVDAVADELSRPIRETKETVVGAIDEALSSPRRELDRQVEGLRARILDELTIRLKGGRATVGVRSRIQARWALRRLDRTGLLGRDGPALREPLKRLAALGIERATSAAVVAVAVAAPAGEAAHALLAEESPSSPTPVPATVVVVEVEESTPVGLSIRSGAEQRNLVADTDPGNGDPTVGEGTDGGRPPFISDRGRVVGTPTEDDGGRTFTFREAESEADSSSGTVRVEIRVAETHAPPPLAPIPSIVVAEGACVGFPALADDPDSPLTDLAYSLGPADDGTGPPVGLIVDPATGLIEWAPLPHQGPRVWAFDVVVTDPDGGQARRPAEIVILPRVFPGDSLWAVPERMLIAEADRGPDHRPLPSEVGARVEQLRLANRRLVDPDLIHTVDQLVASPDSSGASTTSDSLPTPDGCLTQRRVRHRRVPVPISTMCFGHRSDRGEPGTVTRQAPTPPR